MGSPRNFYFVLVSENGERDLKGDLRGKDLATLLTLLDEAISSNIKHNTGDDGGGLRIQSIKPGSLRIACRGTKQQHNSYESLIAGVNQGEHILPPMTRQAIFKLREFNSSIDSRLEFRDTIRALPRATLYKCPQKQIFVGSQTVQTTTTLYGKIAAISGVSSIRVTLSLINFSGQVSFHVSNGESRQLGSRYGEVVGVLGNAEIQLPDRTVTNFNKIRIVEYNETNILESTRMLQERYSKYFNTIHDVNAFVAEQRG